MLILKIFKPKNLIRIIFNPHLIVIRLYYNLLRLFSDIAALFGKYKYKYNIIFLAGMPMSATTLVKNMFGFIPGYYTRYTPMPYETQIKADISQTAFRYCPKWGYTLFKTHLNPWDSNINIIKKNNVKKVIVTYRDLRDVSLSRYHRLFNWPKEKNEPHYIDYKSMNKEEGINHSISIVAKEFIPWMQGWFDVAKKNENFVLFCTFENLVTKPKEEFTKMLNFYEIDLPKEKIDEIIERTKGKGNMVKNMYQSALLPWAMSTNFRSGKIGSWKKEFTINNIENFKKLAGNYLIELGYEKNNDW